VIVTKNSNAKGEDAPPLVKTIGIPPQL